MKGQKQIALASLVILLVPALFYLLLSRGKNEFVHLPVYGNFSLGNSFTDQKNNILTDENIKEKFLVTGFYTINADTMNQILNGHLKKIQNKFSNADDVRIISFMLSSSGLLPSPQGTAQKEGVLYGKWYLTDFKNESILRNTQSALGIKKSIDPGQCYKNIYLIDKQKRIRGIHDGTDPYAVDTLMDEIKLLRWEEWKKDKK